MFKLYMHYGQHVYLEEDGTKIIGDETDIITTMLLSGVDSSEILKGLREIQRDKVAVFGINKMFIYSYNLSHAA